MSSAIPLIVFMRKEDKVKAIVSNDMAALSLEQRIFFVRYMYIHHGENKLIKLIRANTRTCSPRIDFKSNIEYV